MLQSKKYNSNTFKAGNLVNIRLKSFPDMFILPIKLKNKNIFYLNSNRIPLDLFDILKIKPISCKIRSNILDHDFKKLCNIRDGF